MGSALGSMIAGTGAYEWGAIAIIGVASSFAIWKELADKRSGVNIRRFKCTKSDTGQELYAKTLALTQVDKRTVKWRRYLFLAVVLVAIAMILQIKPNPRSIAIGIIVIWIAVYLFQSMFDDREVAMKQLRGCIAKLTKG